MPGRNQSTNGGQAPFSGLDRHHRGYLIAAAHSPADDPCGSVGHGIARARQRCPSSLKKPPRAQTALCLRGLVSLPWSISNPPQVVLYRPGMAKFPRVREQHIAVFGESGSGVSPVNGAISF